MCRVGQACSVEEAEEDRALFEQVARGDADMDYSTCRWVTVTAMYTRLLEERVGRLENRVAGQEDRIAALEAAVAPPRGGDDGAIPWAEYLYGRS